MKPIISVWMSEALCNMLLEAIRNPELLSQPHWPTQKSWFAELQWEVLHYSYRTRYACTVEDVRYTSRHRLPVVEEPYTLLNPNCKPYLPTRKPSPYALALRGSNLTETVLHETEVLSNLGAGLAWHLSRLVVSEAALKGPGLGRSCGCVCVCNLDVFMYVCISIYVYM